MDTIRLKKLNEFARLPEYKSLQANGADVFACIEKEIDLYPSETMLVPLGFSMELPAGKAAVLVPRSGIGHKNGIVLGNLVGLIDSDYRGEVMVSLWNRNEWDNPNYNPSEKAFKIKPGSRIAQMLIIDLPQYHFEWSDELTETERGNGGFGHSGD